MTHVDVAVPDGLLAALKKAPHEVADDGKGESSVIAAYRRGRIDDPRLVLLGLRSAGMWLSDGVIARALRLAGIDS